MIPDEVEIKPALSLIEARVQKEADSAGCTIHQGAFNNVRGEWFELFLNSRFYNLSKKNGRYCIFSIPNVNSTPFVEFFNTEVVERLKELETNLRKQDIELQMSNPDFLCVDLSKVEPDVSKEALSHERLKLFDEDSAQFLNDLHKIFIGNVRSMRSSSQFPQKHQSDPIAGINSFMKETSLRHSPHICKRDSGETISK